MSEKYDITVANPPYMGGKYMNPVLLVNMPKITIQIPKVISLRCLLR
ncbi:hypothetical protein H6762_03315 [Candidatus Nomurabacteria bacterium]|nr:hypothetical protein [Candidatus Nomurabacteria bacterium]